MHPALLTAVDCSSQVHLIIGSNPLAAARCTRSIEVGARPKLIAPAHAQLHYGLVNRIEAGEVEWIQRDFRDEDLKELGREEVDRVVDAVFVTLGGKDKLSIHISNLCRRLRIPVNVADTPSLCTFTILSTHSDGPIQIGVTTSGKGCKLASRIRREIASTLPADLGVAVSRLGAMRRRIWEEDHAALDAEDLDAGEDDDAGQTAAFNQLVTPEDRLAAKTRRMRWLSQICEYWPLARLAAITDADVEAVLRAYTSSSLDAPTATTPSLPSALHPSPVARNGRIILAGSGPGHPALLTTATHHYIRTSTLILADKLVPAPILALIPRRTPVHIARKFPGNADTAQEELLSLALAALRAGHTVLRLKQGDPYIYGRGAEEHAFFTARGFPPLVLPGITSALSAPLFARIPPTHRAVADQVLLCTGTGRKGAAPDPPEYVSSRTVVFLMALHRLDALVASLVDRPTAPWPKDTPCAVIERASCADQRVVRTSLAHVGAAIEELGSRPPGLLVLGRACEVLVKLDPAEKWRVEEGFAGFDLGDIPEAGLEGLDGVLNGTNGANCAEDHIPPYTEKGLASTAVAPSWPSAAELLKSVELGRE